MIRTGLAGEYPFKKPRQPAAARPGLCAGTYSESSTMDLIDYLKIYKARTIKKPQSYFYAPSTKAVQELKRWPSRWP